MRFVANTRELIQFIARTILFIFATSLLTLGAFLDYKNNTGSATSAFGFGILVLFFAFIHEFQKFKGFGIEAELREKIREADDTIKKLRDIALPLAAINLKMLNRLGRWSGPISRKNRFEFVNTIGKELKGLGISDSQLDELNAETHTFNENDLLHEVEFGINSVLKTKIDSARFDMDNAMMDIQKPLQGIGVMDPSAMIQVNEKNSTHQELLETANNLTGNISLNVERWKQNGNSELLEKDIISIIQECSFLSSEEKDSISIEIKERIKDLTYYREHHSFRREDVWFKNEDE